MQGIAFTPLCAEGATFAQINPRMDQKTPRPVSVVVPKADDVPKPLPPSEDQEIDFRPNYSGADVLEALNSEPVSLPGWRAAPICGVITIINQDWRPKYPKAVPPSVTNKLGMFLSAQWAMMFNGSTNARRKGHWALVTCRGNVIILSGIRLQDRPINPSDFPPCVIAGLSYDVADQMAAGANTPRVEFAQVPREWTVAVRRADSIEEEQETPQGQAVTEEGGEA